MISNTASLDLVEYIETTILPRYSMFDKAHNMAHVTSVIRRSLDLVRATGADINMVYVIAAYHDIGMSGHGLCIISQAGGFLPVTCVCANGSRRSRSR